MEFLELVQNRFNGYELVLGYSMDNTQAIDFLSNNGFECIETNNNNTAFLNEYTPIVTDDNVIRITRDNYEYYRTLHQKVEDDMYWNSDRIYADLDNWNIFVKLQNSEPVGSVYYLIADDGWYEIFGIDMKDDTFDTQNFCDLLGTALNTAKESGGKYMTFFCDDEAQKLVSKLGFECVDRYVCYRIQLG